jgi:hypothetical protein
MAGSHSLQRWEDELAAARREEAAALQALATLEPAAERAERQRLRDRLSLARDRKRTAQEVIGGLTNIDSVTPREAPFPALV